MASIKIMKNFDIFVGIDWSGARSPIFSNSIAVSTAQWGKSSPVIDDIKWSRTSVVDYILSLQNIKKRILIGIDCNFGYAKAIVEKQFGDDYIAPQMWERVDDICKDDENFFAGRFWQHSLYQKYFWSKGKRPKIFEMPQRLTEKMCAQNGLGNPESPFKLIGAKQVGKGGLSGMRVLCHLKQELGDKLAVFPFDDEYDNAQIVITEIYPRLFLRLCGHRHTKIRNKKDLNDALVSLKSQEFQQNIPFSDHQTDAIISAAGLRYLCGRGKTIPIEISHPTAPKNLLQSEGWIFGVGTKETRSTIS